MNRRTFMLSGAWLSTLAASAWPCLAGAASRGDTPAIVDCSLSCGPAFARHAVHLGLPVFETGDDIGALWYTTLAPRLTPMSSLIGVIRASDYFVLHELVTRAGLVADKVGALNFPLADEHAHTAFTFTRRTFQRDEG